MISHQSTSALYQWVAYFFQSEIPTQMYFKLVYNCICNLLHVHSKWMICVQSIEVKNQKKSKTILYISFKIFCYVSERQNIFSFYSKLAYITYQEGRHKHLKSLGREGNILLFLLSSLWQSTIQSYLSLLLWGKETGSQCSNSPTAEYPTFGCLMVLSLLVFVLVPILTSCIFNALCWVVELLSKSILRLKSIFCVPQINKTSSSNS